MKPIEEQGYLIVATNTAETDYVECSKTLAKTIKFWHPDARICLLTDQPVEPGYLFNHVRTFPFPLSQNPYANDWQIFHATPFRETIKLEGDMLITGPLDHWWTLLRLRDVAISTGCKNWKNQTARSRHYRQVFDANDLPDVYNAITYWRLSQTAQEFFNTVQNIFENWDQYRTTLKFPEEQPSTDLVYAMAAAIIGPERCTMPFTTYPRIIHMKRHIHAGKRERWMDEMLWEYKNYMLRINTVTQHGAFHYHIKDWLHD